MYIYPTICSNSKYYRKIAIYEHSRWKSENYGKWKRTMKYKIEWTVIILIKPLLSNDYIDKITRGSD